MGAGSGEDEQRDRREPDREARAAGRRIVARGRRAAWIVDRDLDGAILLG
jgi:hypothetical protein